MNMIETKISGRYTVSIFTENSILNNGQHVTEYTVVKMHNEKLDHYGNRKRIYKRLQTAMKNYDEL